MSRRGTRGQKRPQLRPNAQRKLMRQLRERDGDLCVWCREPIRTEPAAPRDPLNPSIEHLIPWRVCRSNDLDVLALAHIACNHLAHSRLQRQHLRREVQLLCPL